MFSSRFKWEFEHNQLSTLLAQKRADDAVILDLTESNPTRAQFAYPREEILEALSHAEMLSYSPEARGSASARSAVARYYHEGGISVDADRVHLTSSTSEAYAFLCKLLADPGDEILIPQPSYPLFEFLAGFEGVALRPYALSYQHPKGWRIDHDSLRAGVTQRTRAVITVNPNNPTGSFVAEDRTQLVQFCSDNGLALIADEVFADYSWNGSPLSETSLTTQAEALTFVLSGLSKVSGLPQMKLGWIVASGPENLLREAEERLDLIADTYLSVGTPVQVALPALLKIRSSVQAGINSRLSQNLQAILEFVEDTPCRLLSAEGGWYATVEIPRHRSEEDWVLKFLDEDDVLIHPGYFFNFEREAYLIFSLLTPEAILRTACTRLRRHFQ